LNFFNRLLALTFDLVRTMKDQMTYKISILTALLLLTSTLAHSQAVTVWPGDANNNGIANHVDLLYVGLGFGSSGPARNGGPSTGWQATQTPAPWQLATQSNLNYAYFDCNGDGSIDDMDTLAIVQNYDLTHDSLMPDTNSIVAFGSPPLTLDFQQDSIFIAGTTTIMVNIRLGSAQQPVNGLHGLAFTLDYDVNAIDSITYSLPGGFVSAGTNAIRIAKNKPNLGKIEMAISRVNQSNISGYGVIGTIIIVMDDDLKINQDYSMPITISQITALGAGEVPLGLTPVGDTLYISTPNVSIDDPVDHLTIYPQPASQHLAIHADQGTLEKTSIYTLHGQLIREQPAESPFDTRIDLTGLPSGSYLLAAQTSQGVLRKTIRIRKE